MRWPEDNKGPRTKGECKIKQFCRVNRDLTFCQEKFPRTRTVVLCNPFSKTDESRDGERPGGELYIFKINYSTYKECVLFGNSIIKVFRTLSVPAAYREFGHLKCLIRRRNLDVTAGL